MASVLQISMSVVGYPPKTERDQSSTAYSTRRTRLRLSAGTTYYQSSVVVVVCSRRISQAEVGRKSVN
jgi:hypothetical protein